MRQRPFIAIDWGTTNRRCYHIDGDGHVLRSDRDNRGITAFAAEPFDAEVDRLQTLYEGLPLVMAGMIGSNRGWIDAGYVGCPATFEDLAAAVVQPRPGTMIIPGVSTRINGRADVMRGEEVQLLGAVAAGLVPADALLCQPGTHAKWVTMAGGGIADFVTAMTGEMFDLLKAHSLIGREMTGDVADDDAFRTGLEAADRDDVLAQLFSVRPASLLGTRPAASAASYVSGLLIGSDCRARLRHKPQTVYLLATEPLAGLYARAIAQQNAEPRIIDSNHAFVAGMSRLWSRLG